MTTNTKNLRDAAAAPQQEIEWIKLEKTDNPDNLFPIEVGFSVGKLNLDHWLNLHRDAVSYMEVTANQTVIVFFKEIVAANKFRYTFMDHVWVRAEASQGDKQ
jgi:hypothetical protein